MRMGWLESAIYLLVVALLAWAAFGDVLYRLAGL